MKDDAGSASPSAAAVPAGSSLPAVIVSGQTARKGARAALACLALAGCAAGSGVVPIGPDTYVVSELRAPVLGGGPAAQQAVLEKAARSCQQQGRAFRLLALVPGGDPRTPYWPTAFDAMFQCLSDGQLPASERSGL